MMHFTATTNNNYINNDININKLLAILLVNRLPLVTSYIPQVLASDTVVKYLKEDFSTSCRRVKYTLVNKLISLTCMLIWISTV